MSISENEAQEIFLDRIKFKFHCAEKHLNNLKSFEETKDSEGNKEFFNKTFGIRIKWEDETECVLFHLLGAEDSLLSRINDKFGFGHSPSKITLKNITKSLEKEQKKDLLTELYTALEETNWLYCLTKLRNIGTHRSFLNVKIARSPKGYGDDSIPQIVSLKDAPDIDVISYLEESIQKMKQLIDAIMDKEAKLRQPPK